MSRLACTWPCSAPCPYTVIRLLLTTLFFFVGFQVVEEARRRLLEQHGAAVEGYLPKGSLKSRDELELVRDLSKKNTQTNDAVGRYLSSPLLGNHG